MNTTDLIARIKKHPTSFGCLLVSLVCGVIIYLHLDDISTRQTELEAKSAEAAKMSANIRNATNLAEQVSEIQAATKELDARLMKAGQLAVNLQYFYKLEAETEVKLVDVRPNGVPRNNKTQFVGVSYSVSIQGSYAKVMNFVNRLQNGRHLCRIITASFNKSGGAADVSGTDMTLALTVELLGTP